MALTQKEKEYLDNLKDDELIFLLHARYSTLVPITEKCTKEEYDKNHKEKFETWQDIVDWIDSDVAYVAIPYWNNGGGLLDQISNKKPDGYTYEKIVGNKKILCMGGDMIDYCHTRECMKCYFENQTLKSKN